MKLCKRLLAAALEPKSSKRILEETHKYVSATSMWWFGRQQTTKQVMRGPTRKGKRPFLESREARVTRRHRRRNSGPPQFQPWHTLHIVQEKGNEPNFNAARFRASVETDLTNDIELKRACQTTKANESRSRWQNHRFATRKKWPWPRHKPMVAMESHLYLME